MAQMVDTVEAEQAITSIIRERDYLKTQVVQKDRIIQDKDEEIAELEKLKELEMFRPLLEDDAAVYQFFLRDKPLVTQLKAKVLSWYGSGADTLSADKDVARNARHIVETVIEECVRYGIMNVPQIIRGLLDARP